MYCTACGRPIMPGDNHSRCHGRKQTGGGRGNREWNENDRNERDRERQLAPTRKQEELRLRAEHEVAEQQVRRQLDILGAEHCQSLAEIKTMLREVTDEVDTIQRQRGWPSVDRGTYRIMEVLMGEAGALQERADEVHRQLEILRAPYKAQVQAMRQEFEARLQRHLEALK